MRLIAAVDKSWGLGKDGKLLFSIPEDMKFFREQTKGKVLVMGRSTLESFPGGRPLPARLNIVLSRQQDLKIPGTIVCSGLKQLKEVLKSFHSEDVMVIGGGSVYGQLYPYCEEAYITKMRFTAEADCRLPDLDADEDWNCVNETDAAEYEGVAYSFCTYRNHTPKPMEFQGLNDSLSSFFKKKTILETEIFADRSSEVAENYRRELYHLAQAYFYPLKTGVASAELDSWIEARRISPEFSLLSYLKSRGDLAEAEDFALLAEKYDSAGMEKTPAAVNKEELETLLSDKEIKR